MRPSFQFRPSRRAIAVAAGVLWMAVIVSGLAWVAAYDNRPGPGAHAPVRWPVATRMARSTTRATLVMFAHPLCDCTAASLTELAELLARASPQPDVRVLFVDPGLPDGWQNSSNVQRARAIAGATVLVDVNGVNARRFGAETSGQVVLYSTDGDLLFSGGITKARGHAGDNVGRASILSLLSTAHAAARETPVFGCSLFGPSETPSFDRGAP